jgi:hypothetical protein
MYDTKAAEPRERVRRLLWSNLINGERKMLMRRTVQSLALMLALCVPASAGIMQCPVASPTPPPASATQEPTTNGIIQNESADSLTQIVLDLLAAFPSLF